MARLGEDKLRPLGVPIITKPTSIKFAISKCDDEDVKRWLVAALHVFGPDVIVSEMSKAADFAVQESLF